MHTKHWPEKQPYRIFTLASTCPRGAITSESLGLASTRSRAEDQSPPSSGLEDVAITVRETGGSPVESLHEASLAIQAVEPEAPEIGVPVREGYLQVGVSPLPVVFLPMMVTCPELPLRQELFVPLVRVPTCSWQATSRSHLPTKNCY